MAVAEVATICNNRNQLRDHHIFHARTLSTSTTHRNQAYSRVCCELESTSCKTGSVPAPWWCARTEATLLGGGGGGGGQEWRGGVSGPNEPSVQHTRMWHAVGAPRVKVLM